MPEVSIAPAPGAPTPAPSPSPSPAPKPAPAPAKVSDAAPTPSQEAKQAGVETESAFDKLEARYSPKPATKTDDAKPPKTDDKAKPDAVAPDKAKPEPKADDRQFQEGPKALREQLAKVNKERDDLSKSIPELKQKIAEYEAKGKDTSALTEQLTRERQEKDALQAEIRMLKKEVSPDFREKWDKPFEKQVGRAMKDMEGMVVLGEKDPDTGEQRTADRPAVWADFQAIYSMPPNKAIAASRKLFGPDASAVVEHHMTRLRDMQFDRDSALEEERVRWKQNSEMEVANQAMEREKFVKMKEAAHKALIEQHPELYDVDPADPEGNELLTVAREYMEAVPRTEDEMHKQYARNYLNAIAAPRLAHRLEKANARIVELESVVAEMKNSSPISSKRTTQSTAGSSEKTWEQEMREAANV